MKNIIVFISAILLSEGFIACSSSKKNSSQPTFVKTGLPIFLEATQDCESKLIYSAIADRSTLKGFRIVNEEEFDNLKKDYFKKVFSATISADRIKKGNLTSETEMKNRLSNDPTTARHVVLMDRSCYENDNYVYLIIRDEPRPASIASSRIRILKTNDTLLLYNAIADSIIKKY